MIEGTLIVLAAVVILNEAWAAWRHPAPLQAPALGLGMNAVSTLINGFWGWLLVRRGRALRSAALVADGQHVLSDVVTSVGVLIGVALVFATGIRALDRGGGGGDGGVHPGRRPARDRRLRRRADGRGARPRTWWRASAASSAESAEGALEAHDLRTRSAGRITFLEFHLVVPGAMTVAAAHDICDRIETALKAEMDDLVITIHVEPEGKAKHHGVLVL